MNSQPEGLHSEPLSKPIQRIQPNSNGLSIEKNEVLTSHSAIQKAIQGTREAIVLANLTIQESERLFPSSKDVKIVHSLPTNNTENLHESGNGYLGGVSQLTAGNTSCKAPVSAKHAVSNAIKGTREAIVLANLTIQESERLLSSYKDLKIVHSLLTNNTENLPLSGNGCLGGVSQLTAGNTSCKVSVSAKHAVSNGENAKCTNTLQSPKQVAVTTSSFDCQMKQRVIESPGQGQGGDKRVPARNSGIPIPVPGSSQQPRKICDPKLQNSVTTPSSGKPGSVQVMNTNVNSSGIQGNKGQAKEDGQAPVVTQCTRNSGAVQIASVTITSSISKSGIGQATTANTNATMLQQSRNTCGPKLQQPQLQSTGKCGPGQAVGITSKSSSNQGNIQHPSKTCAARLQTFDNIQPAGKSVFQQGASANTQNARSIHTTAQNTGNERTAKHPIHGFQDSGRCQTEGSQYCRQQENQKTKMSLYKKEYKDHEQTLLEELKKISTAKKALQEREQHKLNSNEAAKLKHSKKSLRDREDRALRIYLMVEGVDISGGPQDSDDAWMQFLWAHFKEAWFRNAENVCSLDAAEHPLNVHTGSSSSMESTEDLSRSFRAAPRRLLESLRNKVGSFLGTKKARPRGLGEVLEFDDIATLACSDSSGSLDSAKVSFNKGLSGSLEACCYTKSPQSAYRRCDLHVPVNEKTSLDGVTPDKHQRAKAYNPQQTAKPTGGVCQGMDPALQKNKWNAQTIKEVNGKAEEKDRLTQQKSGSAIEIVISNPETQCQLEEPKKSSESKIEILVTQPEKTECSNSAPSLSTQVCKKKEVRRELSFDGDNSVTDGVTSASPEKGDVTATSPEKQTSPTKGAAEPDIPSDKNLTASGQKKKKLNKNKSGGGGNFNYRKSINCCCEFTCEYCIPSWEWDKVVTAKRSRRKR